MCGEEMVSGTDTAPIPEHSLPLVEHYRDCNAKSAGRGWVCRRIFRFYRDIPLRPAAGAGGRFPDCVPFPAESVGKHVADALLSNR
jgi:hypothetical protein